MWGPLRPKDLTLNEIENISDYAAFVKAGKEEFNKTADKGVGLTFWYFGGLGIS
jgi:hypothetical protein